MSGGRRTIHVTGTYVEGDVNLRAGDFVSGDQYKVDAAVASWFQPVHQAIARRPRTTRQKRAALTTSVTEIQKEVQKGDQADRGFLAARLDALKNMAPDIFEVALATLANPAAGLGLAMKKVAKRAAEAASHAS